MASTATNCTCRKDFFSWNVLRLISRESYLQCNFQCYWDHNYLVPFVWHRRNTLYNILILLALSYRTLIHVHACITRVTKTVKYHAVFIQRIWYTINPIRWRHNERGDVSNHQRLDGLLNRLFRCRSKKASKLHVTGLCEGNSPVAGEFP